MFGVANTRCMCFVIGMYAAKPRKTSTCAHQETPRSALTAASGSPERPPATTELNGWYAIGDGSPAARCLSSTVEPVRTKNVT